MRYNWLSECLEYTSQKKNPSKFISQLKWYQGHAEEIAQAFLSLKVDVPSDWENRIANLPLLLNARMQIFSIYVPETEDKLRKIYLELQLCEMAAKIIQKENVKSIDDLKYLSDFKIDQCVRASVFAQADILLRLAKILVRNYIYFLKLDEPLGTDLTNLRESQFLRLESIPLMTVVNPNVIKRFFED